MRKLVTFFVKQYQVNLQPCIVDYLASKKMSLEDWLFSVGENRRGDILSVFLLCMVTGMQAFIHLQDGNIWSTLRMKPSDHDKLLELCDLHLVYMGFGIFLRLIRHTPMDTHVSITIGEITSDDPGMLANLACKIKQEQEFMGTMPKLQSTSKRPTAAPGSVSQLPCVETELKAETSMVKWPSKIPGVNTSRFCVKLKCLTVEEISKYSHGKTTLTQPQVHTSEAKKLKVRSSSTSKHPKDLLPSHSSISSADPPVTRSKNWQSNIEKQQRRKITGHPSELTNIKQFTFQLHRHVLRKRKSKITLRCKGL